MESTDLNELHQSTKFHKRLLLALLVSLILHLLLFTFIYLLLDEIGAEISGEGGFDSGSGLLITIGNPESKEVLTEKEKQIPEESIGSPDTEVKKTPLEFMENRLPEESAGSEVSGKSDSQYFGGEVDGEKDYRAEIINTLNKHRRYHKVARQRGLEGKNIIGFSIASDGSLLDYEILESSGERLIDKSAIQMVLDSAPFPEFPEGVNENSMRFEVPLQFSLGN